MNMYPVLVAMQGMYFGVNLHTLFKLFLKQTLLFSCSLEVNGGPPPNIYSTNRGGMYLNETAKESLLVQVLNFTLFV